MPSLDEEENGSPLQEKGLKQEKSRRHSKENGDDSRRSAEKERRMKQKLMDRKRRDKSSKERKEKRDEKRRRHREDRSKDDRTKRKNKKRASGNVKGDSATKGKSTSGSSQEISILLDRLHDASVAKQLEAEISSTGTDLTRIPWSIKLINEAKEVEGKETTTPPLEQTKVCATGVENDGSTKTYPFFSYMDLRRKQNNNWATLRLEAGVRFAKESKWRQAEACYKEGLDLVPNHAELLVAYGALCANTGREKEAIAMLERVVKEFPGVANAQQYLDAILNKNGGATVAVPKTSAAETALRDALAERAFMEGDATRTEQVASNDIDYPILPLDDDPRSRSSEKSHHRKERKRRKHKHSRRGRRRRHDRKRHRRYRSPSFSDSSDSQQRHKRRRHRSPSLSCSGTSQNSHSRRHKSSSVEKSPGNCQNVDQAEKQELGNLEPVQNEINRGRSPSSSSFSISHERRRVQKHRSPSLAESDVSQFSGTRRVNNEVDGGTPDHSDSTRNTCRSSKTKQSRRQHKRQHKHKRHRYSSGSDSDASKPSRRRKSHRRRHHRHHSQKRRGRDDSRKEAPNGAKEVEKPIGAAKDDGAAKDITVTT